jgi:hypothetical protein
MLTRGIRPDEAISPGYFYYCQCKGLILTAEAVSYCNNDYMGMVFYLAAMIVVVQISDYV